MTENHNSQSRREMTTMSNEVQIIRGIGLYHRPIRVNVTKNSITCQCGFETQNRDGLEEHRAQMILDALYRIRSEEKLNEIPDAISIHIEVPIFAPDEEVDKFYDDLANFVLSWEHDAPWDPFMHSHAESCEDSDHCYGPGSKAERRLMAKGVEEYASAMEANVSSLLWEKTDYLTDMRDWANQVRPASTHYDPKTKEILDQFREDVV